MGGPSSTQKQAEQTQMQISQDQLALSKQYSDMLQGRLQQGDVLQQPLISYLQKLSSGDPNAVISAASPQLANISRGSQQAKEQIYNTVPAGAARDFALSELPVQTGEQTSSYLNQIINQAPQELAQVGASQYGVGLNLGGLGQGSAQIAGTQAGQVGQLEQQTKASTTGFLGSLAGAAASPFSFGFGK